MQALPEPRRHSRPAQASSADLTNYAFNSFSTKSPPFHVTFDDISPPPERLEIEQITGRQVVRGHGRVIAILYETHWVGLLSPSWERQRDLQHHRLHVLRYWSRTPSQRRQINRLHRQMRIGATHRELSRSRRDIFLASRYSLVARVLWLSHFSSSTLPAGAHLWCKALNGLWCLGRVAHRTSTDNSSANSYIVRFLDDPGPIKINLLPSAYTTSRSAVQGSWHLQRHQTGGLASGVLWNADGACIGADGTVTAPLSVSPAASSQVPSVDGWRIFIILFFVFVFAFAFFFSLSRPPGNFRLASHGRRSHCVLLPPGT